MCSHVGAAWGQAVDPDRTQNDLKLPPVNRAVIIVAHKNPFKPQLAPRFWPALGRPYCSGAPGAHQP